jgi:chloride channel 7
MISSNEGDIETPKFVNGVDEEDGEAEVSTGSSMHELEEKGPFGMQRCVTFMGNDCEEVTISSDRMIRAVSLPPAARTFSSLKLKAKQSTTLMGTALGPEDIRVPESLKRLVDEVFVEFILKWFATISVAVVCAITAGAILVSSMAIVTWKLSLMKHLWQEEYSKSAFALWLTYGFVATLMTTLFVTLVQPSAGGSGVPDVKAYLNGNRMPGTTSVSTWAGRVFGLPLVTSSGLFAGMQGPMAHIGAITAAGISSGQSDFLGCHVAFFKPLKHQKAKLEFMSQGAAIGVAAAFGAPIGGLLFSLEEASTYWTPQTTFHTFVGACIAALLVRLKKTGFQYVPVVGVIEFPGGMDTVQWELWELIPFTGIAVVLGLAGAAFCKLARHITELRVRFFKVGRTSSQVGRRFKRLRIAETVVVTIVTLIVSFVLATHVPCIDNPQRGQAQHGSSNEVHLVNWVCKDPQTQASGLATVLLDSRESAIKALFSSTNDAHFPKSHLFLLFATIYILFLFTNGLSLPVGSFVPSIMMGACFGRLVGRLMVDLFGHGMINTGIYALIGSTAMLAGVSRMTVSLGVVMLEVTGSLRLTLPLMVVIVTSKIISDTITPSLCDIMIALRGIPMLEHERNNRTWRKLKKELIHRCGTSIDQITCIYADRRFLLQDALKLLVDTQHQSWPVLQDPATCRLVGLATRKSLEQFLQQEYMLLDKGSGETEIHLDLISAPTPHVIWNHSSFIDAYNVFRSLQLRSLCIVDERFRLKCIVTRTDLAEVIEETTNAPIMEMRDHVDNCRNGDESVRACSAGRILSHLTRHSGSKQPSKESGLSAPSQDSHPLHTCTSTNRIARRQRRRAAKNLETEEDAAGHGTTAFSGSFDPAAFRYSSHSVASRLTRDCSSYSEQDLQNAQRSLPNQDMEIPVEWPAL